MSVLVHAVGRPELAPFSMSDRFRTEIAYFMSLPEEPGVPKLGEHEYWIDADQSRAVARRRGFPTRLAAR